MQSSNGSSNAVQKGPPAIYSEEAKREENLSRDVSNNEMDHFNYLSDLEIAVPLSV